MSLKTIRRAFETRIATWAQSVSIAVAYENASFTPTQSAYVELFMLPAQTGSQYLSQTDRSYAGICQINIHVPLNAGSADAHNYAGAIAVLFGVSMTQDGLRIYCQPGYELPAQTIDTHFTLPLRIPYRCEVA